MPADLWLLLPAIVAFATAVIFAGYRLATRPTRQAERREAGEGFATLPRLLPSGLPATFDAPDHGRENGATANPCHFRSHGEIG